MRIDFGKGPTEYGPGVDITIDGDELAHAVMLYLYSRGVYVFGPRTVMVNGQLCEGASVYVDPSGSVVDEDGERWSGRGPEENEGEKEAG